MEEPAAAWGIPVEYACIVDIFDYSSLQADIPDRSSVEQQQQQQLVEYNNCAAASQWYSSDRSDRVWCAADGDEHNTSESEGSDHSEAEDTAMENWAESIVDIDGLNGETRISMNGRATAIFKQAAGEFSAGIMMKEKMHRYPASLIGFVREFYTVPIIVAIGPYHHNIGHLRQAEEVKHAAAYHCVNESGSLLEELYGAVVHVADRIRHLYDKDVMEGISIEDFRHMMFFDSCFLVQFMLMRSGARIHRSLRRFLSPNRSEILHDVLLLENQLAWCVVEVVMSFRRVRLNKFLTSLRGCLHDRKLPQQKEDCLLVLDDDDDKGDKPPYKPLHLLGLLRHYIVGTSDTMLCRPKTKNRSVSHSARELAEIGVSLTTNNTGKLIDMQLNQQRTLFAELSLAPLSLDRDRASYLINMAALELCTVESFSEADDEDSAVCSYLLLLAMLAYREEDVHELRTRGLMQGGGGLTNQEALAFFTSLQGLRLGSRYTGIMRQIERYKESKQTATKLYMCLYNHWKTIAVIGSTLVGLSGIIGALASIKSAL